MAAGFGRIPENVLPRELFYAGVDALILLGMVRDWMVNRRVHSVYRYVLPAFIAGQAFVMYTIVHQLTYWRIIAHTLVG